MDEILFAAAHEVAHRCLKIAAIPQFVMLAIFTEKVRSQPARCGFDGVTLVL